MELDDVDAVTAVVDAANEDADRRAGREPHPVSPDQRERFRAGMRRFVEMDGAGAWVAVEDGAVVGMAEAIRRDGFWGLSMLFVDPAHQSRGLGRRLLDATLTYAEDANVRMIMSSPDPRAIRRYALAGLAIHPTVEANGTVDRTTIPADLPGRAGDANDVELVADVDARLRGSRAEDVAHLLRVGFAMEVVERGASRGYALHRGDRLLLLGATDETAASLVLWRALAASGERFGMWSLTAAQDWAVKVALAARLSVTAAGALFVDGMPHLPGPWVPSGWYF